MIKELTEIHANNVNLITQMMHRLSTETISSDFYLKSMRYFHNYYFRQQEKTDHQMEELLQISRIASKDDIKDLVDAQRLVIDLLEDITDRIEALEQHEPSDHRRKPL